MSQIKDGNNQIFQSDADRTDFIVSFFENLYKKPDNEAPQPENVIEDFLGPTICNSNVVKNSKLSEEECAALESPLTINELDNSLERRILGQHPDSTVSRTI